MFTAKKVPYTHLKRVMGEHMIIRLRIKSNPEQTKTVTNKESENIAKEQYRKLQQLLDDNMQLTNVEEQNNTLCTHTPTKKKHPVKLMDKEIKAN